ncbi:MAG: hypothetical protein AAF911_01880 [Planctomycetota bacterium]
MKGLQRTGTFVQRLTTAACLAWGLALGGCGHPMAQRSAWDWQPTRVLAEGTADHPDAYPEPASYEGMYLLARETASQGSETLTYAYVRRGNLVGFLQQDEEIVAVAGSKEFPIEGFSSDTRLVWYHPQVTAGDVATGTLQFAGGILLLGGLLYLSSLNNDDDDDHH